MTVPAGAVLRSTVDGGAEVVGSDGVVVTVVAPPWAVDANGASVLTSYRIEGSTLVQVVAHHGAAYPVVADPNWNVFWNRVSLYFNRAETKTIMNMGWGAAGLSTLCVAAGGGANPIGAAFGLACLAQFGYIVYSAGVAYNSRGCLQLTKYHLVPTVRAQRHNGGTCEL